jgi:hypothetical protein
MIPEVRNQTITITRFLTILNHYVFLKKCYFGQAYRPLAEETFFTESIYSINQAMISIRPSNNVLRLR